MKMLLHLLDIWSCFREITFHFSGSHMGLQSFTRPSCQSDSPGRRKTARTLWIFLWYYKFKNYSFFNRFRPIDRNRKPYNLWVLEIVHWSVKSRSNGYFCLGKNNTDDGEWNIMTGKTGVENLGDVVNIENREERSWSPFPKLNFDFYKIFVTSNL